MMHSFTSSSRTKNVTRSSPGSSVYEVEERYSLVTLLIRILQLEEWLYTSVLPSDSTTSWLSDSKYRLDCEYCSRNSCLSRISYLLCSPYLSRLSYKSHLSYKSRLSYLPRIS